MHIIIDAPPDNQRYIAAFRHVLRPAFRRVRLAGAIIGLLGILELLLPDYRPIGVGFLVAGLLFVFFVPARSVRSGIRFLPMTLRQPQRFELTEQGVQVMSPLVASQFAWAAFEKIEEFSGLLLLMLGRRQVVPVPLDGVPEQQLAELRQFLANQAFARQLSVRT